MISALIGSFLFGMVIVLYILIVLGFPLGEYTMGGKYKILPKHMRIVFVFSIILQLAGVLVLLQTGGYLKLMLPAGITRGMCFFYAFYLTLNVIMNFMSQSKKEKLVMTPLSAITAACFWITAMNSCVIT